MVEGLKLVGDSKVDKYLSDEFVEAWDNIKIEKRQTVFIEYGGRTPLYDALQSCDHKIVDGDNWSGIKCAKCGGWYCA